MVLTVTNWQIDSPCTVGVARVVARETGAENHALHLLPNPTALSWQRAEKKKCFDGDSPRCEYTTNTMSIQFFVVIEKFGFSSNKAELKY